MRSRHLERGSALLMSIIVVLVISAAGVAIIRFASREVVSSTAGRKEAALSACAEAGRQLFLSQWKLLGQHGGALPAFSVAIDQSTGTMVLGGHYSDDAPTPDVQVIRIDPISVGPAMEVNELTNRIGEQVQPMRVVIHCVQGKRQLEVEFGLRYGM